MQIHKTDATQLTGILDNGSKDRASRRTGKTDDLTVEPRYQGYISEALALGDDKNAVEKAKQLLASGALDTPQAAREAAQQMLDLGI